MSPRDIIAAKRDGGVLDAAQIRAFVQGVVDGSFRAEQATALMMAILLRGMDARETADLTCAMRDSGTVLCWDDLPGPVVDKHSTGGVGDKTSLVIAPLAAAAGMYVPMISGRGLGYTGGTLDKLESIPGFSVQQSVDAFCRLVRNQRAAIVAQTPELVPADRILYALRDVTATVESIPLICGSILSKKGAAGLQALVMDVKYGEGAFMADQAAAEALAKALVATAREMGMPCSARLTDMNQPLGRCVGHSVEVLECVEVMRGGGPADLRHLILNLTADMAVLAGLTGDHAAHYAALARLLDGGQALEWFARMVAGQGGDCRFLERPSELAVAPVRVEVTATAASVGTVAHVSAAAIARLVHAMGAGRDYPGAAIDRAVGVSHLVQAGTRLAAGEVMAVLYLNPAHDAAVYADRLRAAVTVR
jgi:pyrimidine-nucleoside phosphorylase